MDKGEAGWLWMRGLASHKSPHEQPPPAAIHHLRSRLPDASRPPLHFVLLCELCSFNASYTLPITTDCTTSSGPLASQPVGFGLSARRSHHPSDIQRCPSSPIATWSPYCHLSYPPLLQISIVVWKKLTRCVAAPEFRRARCTVMLDFTPGIIISSSDDSSLRHSSS